jgi:bifunctional non-homologous end joining protein LigD
MINYSDFLNKLREQVDKYPYDTKFVIHDHNATTHHFDLRIEKNDKLISWAVPKAKLPIDTESILAVRTPDHEMSWFTFKGTIPEGEYGAGTVDIYDTGTCTIYKWNERVITVYFHGTKISGLYHIIHTKNEDYIIRKAQNIEKYTVKEEQV